MTDPKHSASDWNLQNLPVLTEVVDDEDVGTLDVPAFDFSAELDELARSLPPEDVPELELPPELSLDDVLGEVAASDAGQAPALDASKLIESLPSLDLEVDLPGELTLDDVLPGMAMAADSDGEAVESTDFAFLLDAAGAAAPVASAEAGLDALFARARFEPVLPEADAGTLTTAEPYRVDNDETAVAALTAQLDQFAAPAEMPDLPVDAFLVAGAVDVAANVSTDGTLIPAAEPDPVWADNWQPPQLPDPVDEALPPVVSDVLAAEPPLLAEEAITPPPAADGSYHVSMDDFLAALQPAVAADEALQVATLATAGLDDAANLDVASPASVAPWDDTVVATEVLPVDAAFAVEAAESCELGAGEPSEAIFGSELPESTAVMAEAALAADADGALGEPVAPDWLAEPLAQPGVAAESLTPLADDAVPGSEPAVEVVVPASAALPPEAPVALTPVLTDLADSLAEDDGWPQEMASAEPEEPAALPAMSTPPAAVALDTADWQPEAEVSLDEEAGWPQHAEAAPAVVDSVAGVEPVLPAVDGPLESTADVTGEATADWSTLDTAPDAPRMHAAPPLQAISLDSLPTGVLGGGLGLANAAAAVTAAAQLGAAAERLPGGDAWPLRDQLRSSADERDVEQDWARDLHAEAPQAPLAMALEPEAMVMRSRRQPIPESSEFSLALAVEPPFTMAPTPLPVDSADIRVESVTPPLAAGSALGNVNEDALIEALYARVLPRMKVELTLWMQDALEQQAKSLISGVMQQMKEDFDMMLAQSLKESLREALDEVAPRQGKDN